MRRNSTCPAVCSGLAEGSPLAPPSSHAVASAGAVIPSADGREAGGLAEQQRRMLEKRIAEHPDAARVQQEFDAAA